MGNVGIYLAVMDTTLGASYPLRLSHSHCPSPALYNWNTNIDKNVSHNLSLFLQEKGFSNFRCRNWRSMSAFRLLCFIFACPPVRRWGRITASHTAVPGSILVRGDQCRSNIMIYCGNPGIETNNDWGDWSDELSPLSADKYKQGQ